MGTDRFLSWQLGHVRKWPVAVPASEAGSAVTRQLFVWGEVVDGQQLHFRSGTLDLSLHFSLRSTPRALRRELADALPPSPWRLRIEPDPSRSDWWQGDLELMSSALPAELERVPLHFPAEFWAAHPEQSKAKDRLLRQWRDELSIPFRNGFVLVVEAPLLAIQEARGASFVLDGRERVEVRIEGPPGAQTFVAERLVAPEGKRELRSARLIHTRSLELTEGATAPARCDLSSFQSAHELLEAWLQYDGFEKEHEDELYQLRSAAPLEFNHMVSGEGDTFEVTVVSGSYEDWLPEAAGTAAVNVPVQLAALMTEEKPREATLVRFNAGGGLATAVLRMKDPTAHPPGQGRILVVEDHGTVKARERRKNAVRRLAEGEFANPRLLEWLMRPELVRPAAGTAETFLRSRSWLSLEPRQAEAVAKAARGPGLLLIQGPPGTGKTQVIAELVAELVRRSERSQEGTSGPLRILIAGAHNEAVWNAARRISRDSVVRVDSADAELLARHKETIDEAGRRIASLVRVNLGSSDTFARIQRLENFRGRLTVALRDLSASGVEDSEASFLRLREELAEGDLGDDVCREHDELCSELQSPPATDDNRTSPPKGVDAQRVIELLAQARSSAHTAPGNPAALAKLLPALTEARDAICEGPASVPDVVLAELEEWCSLQPRVTAAAQSGNDLPHTVLARIAGICELPLDRGFAMKPPPDAVEDERRIRLERRMAAWCSRAFADCRKHLDSLKETDEFALVEWVQALEQEPDAYRRIQDKHAPVSSATCQRASRLELPDGEGYDFVIVDEAGRVGADILIPMTLGRNVILVGDDKQLPPHVQSDLWKQLDARLQQEVSAPGSSLFAWLRSRLPAENFVALDRQFRMHENIGRLVSRAFYEPDVVLTHHFEGPKSPERLAGLGLFADEPVVWVDTKDRPDRSGHAALRRNPYELDVIRALLGALDPEKVRSLASRHSPPIALLCFYKDQRGAFEEAFQQGPEWMRKHVELGTVHSVQGREFPLVILATTRSDLHGNVGFLTDWSSANVAISRAQSQVVIVGDSDTLASNRPNRGSPPWRRVFELLSAGKADGITGRIEPAAKVLQWSNPRN